MWADALGAALLVAALLLALPSAVLLAQVVMAWREARGPRGQALPGPARPPVAVLVPAHDEAGGIVATLASITRQLRPGDRLLVVADNCSDETALLARAWRGLPGPFGALPAAGLTVRRFMGDLANDGKGEVLVRD